MRLPTLTIRCCWQMTPSESVTGQDSCILVLMCRNRTKPPMCNKAVIFSFCADSCALSHVSYCELSSKPADSHLPSRAIRHVGRIKDVPRVTEVQAQGGITIGKSIAIVASLVKPSLGNLCPCTYPCQSYKRCAD